MKKVGMDRVRLAAHGGSWYDANSVSLHNQLHLWLRDAHKDLSTQFFPSSVGQGGVSTADGAGASVLNAIAGRAKAIIVPHAGYRYSGKTAAAAYYVMGEAVAANEEMTRIVVLGPSHHLHLSSCALPSVKRYQTPFGDIPIDTAFIQTLRSHPDATGAPFETLSVSDDEDEHSIEMQLPFIKHVMDTKAPGRAWSLVPILGARSLCSPTILAPPWSTDYVLIRPVGHIGMASETSEAMGKLLAPLLQDPTNFIIISSDFCHWGKRFSYTYQDKHAGSICESIVQLDKNGMKAVVSAKPTQFAQYIKDTKNTICGRHPIGILLDALALVPEHTLRVDFVKYAQSSRCENASKDSSVSYAAGVVYRGSPDLTVSCHHIDQLSLTVVSEDKVS
jgi:MEMO1 family protein